jgi:Tfp pilus assembly protein PilP
VNVRIPLVLCACLALSGLTPAAAQEPVVPAGAVTPAAGAPADAAPAAIDTTPADPPAFLESPGPGYTYVPAGRRDPFVSLLRRGADSDPLAGGARPRGLAGLRAAELTLLGTLESQGGYVGLVRGADSRTYVVRAGDQLADGTIQAITPDSMVILQQVNEPLSRERQREVRKVLRPSDEARR